MSIRALLIGFVFLAALIASGGASAYDGSSGIDYDVENVTLTGSSATWKEDGDMNYSVQCLYWGWDWDHDRYCSWYYVEIAYASVVGELHRETQSDPVNSAYDRDYERAETTVAEANPERDNWMTQGEHYAEVDSYLVYCDYFFCYWYYEGTAVYHEDTSESEKEEVCGEAQLDALMREYDDESYDVNLDPGCDAFADSGDSKHFSWAELNGGFSDGNPHEPYGMVTQKLKDGLDYIASNYENFEGIKLTSGYRCPHGNADVGGVINSAHVHGTAADLLRSGGWTEAEFNAVKKVAEKGGAVAVTDDYDTYTDHHLHVQF